MRARHDSIGEAIRRNRREQGHTQESLAFELGVDRTTVGKWERDRASPSPRNMHTLVLRGLLEDSTVRHGSRTSPGWQALPPALAERVTSTFGCHVSELRVRAARLRDDAELALVSFFRMLPVEQQRSFLEIISSMNAAVAPKR